MPGLIVLPVAAPSNVTVLVPFVNVPPVPFQLPATVISKELVSNVPAELVKLPSILMLLVRSCSVPAPECNTLLNNLPDAVPPLFKVCVPVALVKSTVPVPGVKVPELVQLPATLRA